MAERQQSSGKDAPTSPKPAPSGSATQAVQSAAASATPSIPRNVQSAETVHNVQDAQSQQSAYTAETVIDAASIIAVAPVHSDTVKQFELAVAGEPLHRMRRYLELIQVTSVELPNSEPLAALLITVKQALQQLFTVPTQIDDTP
jgi:hypothetical protein